MKTRDIEQILTSMGYWLSRSSSHKIFTNGAVNVPLPHHVEINKFLAKKILRQAQKGVELLQGVKVA